MLNRVSPEVFGTVECICAPENKMGNPANLKPGSMISVELMTGDMSVGADGTVTAIDGNKLYAFGHRFLAVGPTDLPFTRSEVMALLYPGRSGVSKRTVKKR